jgi:hypothetical protein
MAADGDVISIIVTDVGVDRAGPSEGSSGVESEGHSVSALELVLVL